MADPSIQTFCCHRDPMSDDAVGFLSEFNSDSYNNVCLASSTIGIFGAIYQILPRENEVSSQRGYMASANRGRYIVVWLAIADLLASLGVFIRSIFWLNLNKNMQMESQLVTVLCAVSAAWIQYFYMVTWLWTMVYAIDMRLVLKEREGHPFRYHLAVWSIPAVLTAVGLSVLYVPDANCHSVHSVSAAILRILPNYFATYLPMAVVMIVNPCLYFTLSREVEVLISRSLAQFTNKERQTMDLIRFKFSLINLSFYACWLPNLINGVLIWALWFNLPENVLLSLWYVMAVMNPLQALFNSLVYRRWSGNSDRVYIPCRKGVSPLSDSTNFSSTNFSRNSSSASTKTCNFPNESTPLVSSSINCSSASDEEDNFSL